MLTYLPATTQIAAVLALLAAACVTDLRSHRLSNRLTFGGALAGLALAVVLDGATGLLYAGGGLATGFFLFLPGYALGGTSAGDVKLMAAAGSFLGPAGALWAAALTLIAGAVLGLGLLAWRGDLAPFVRRTARTMQVWAYSRQLVHVPPAADEAASLRFPYALAIASGVCMALLVPLPLGGGL